MADILSNNRQLVQALITTYGIITSSELLQYLSWSDMNPSRAATMTIAGVGAAAWMSSNTIPRSDLIPTVGRLAFLLGCMGLLAETLAVGMRRRRPALANITNKM